MNMERPASPSATTVAPTSKRRSTSIETRRSRLASERPPKKGVSSKNAFRSGELTAIDVIYSRFLRRQADQARRDLSTMDTCAGVSDIAILNDLSPERATEPGLSRFRYPVHAGTGYPALDRLEFSRSTSSAATAWKGQRHDQRHITGCGDRYICRWSGLRAGNL